MKKAKVLVIKTIGLLLMGTLIGVLIGFPFLTVDKVTITVTDKERIIDKSGGSRYLVFADDETFENTDSWMWLKFNSSDVQGSLELDHTYKVKVYGWRIPFLSMYRNIVSVEE